MITVHGKIREMPMSSSELNLAEQDFTLKTFYKYRLRQNNYYGEMVFVILNKNTTK